MIDPFEIDDVDELQSIKNDLNFFINKNIVAVLYKEQGQTPLDLKCDRNAARELLQKVIERISVLSITSQLKKVDLPCPQEDSTTYPLED